MTKRLIFIVLAVLLLTSGLSCLGSNPVPVVEITILRQELTKDETGTAVLYLTIKNETRSVAELVDVSVDFYDADRNFVDNARDSIMNLRPDDTWDFTFKCQGTRCSEITSAEVNTTSGSSSGRF